MGLVRSPMKRVLVTGANGFVGRVLCKTLEARGLTVRAAARSARSESVAAAEQVVLGEIGATTDWSQALDGVDCVVHLAARAHILGDAAASSGAYFETNERGTQRLAVEAARAGVRRLIYLSSIKVNGEETSGPPFTAADVPQPQDAYGTSKWLGEKHLLEVSAGSSMEAVIVRSPLVYGPGVRANFLRLLRLVDKQVPLPLGAIHNRRSLVSVWNLCDLLSNVLDSSAASGRTWLVSDGVDLSTPDLMRQIGSAMHRSVRLLTVPVGVLMLGGKLFGKQSEVIRLCGSLALDITPTRALLKWSPPLSVEEGISRTVAWYLQGERRGVA
jgi:nucleoside-diphosphate-sugar epimerase